ncbi:Alpha/Beta hydrolase protein [Mycena galericulata]|nr:Alpha/Beta hydrolase protein [Mycena galericulata]
MPTLFIPGKDIQFFFTDTGPPSNAADYTTLILVHGHTYHSAVFQRLLPLADANHVRIVCINRREYPGSTPHTAQELKVYAEGSQEDRAALMAEAGVNLALYIDEIIQQCGLPSTGGVALAGWSLGNAFTMAMISSIMSLHSRTRERLQSFIKTIIMWDPPSQVLGIVSPPKEYVPLYDQSLSPAERGLTFAKWAANYYIHDHLSARDPDQLNYRDADPSKKATFEDMPIGELLHIVDFTVGDKCDTSLTQPHFSPVLSAIMDKALFDLEIRAAWSGTNFVHMYGEANPWNVIFAVWNVEERVKTTRGRTPITFRPIEGANHFVMWDDPSLTVKELIYCTQPGLERDRVGSKL